MVWGFVKEMNTGEDKLESCVIQANWGILNGGRTQQRSGVIGGQLALWGKEAIYQGEAPVLRDNKGWLDLEKAVLPTQAQ